MQIVVDTSVIIAVISGESQRDALIELTKGADLLAPQSLHWEVGNALSAMLRRDRISLDQALQAISAYRKIPIRFIDVELENSLSIAETLGIYAYDAFMIRAALKYRAPLISLDSYLLTYAKEMNARTIEVN
jgi:predicted nucleic acid-binding protein